MSVFDAYDSEYQSLSQELNKRLAEFRNSDVENGGNIMRHLDGLLAQSNDLIKQMEIEVRTQDPATKKVLNEKVQQYKKSLTSIRTDYERAKADADRANLIDSRSGSDRERFLKTNDKINRQNEAIRNATRTVAETEEVGMEITSELNRNREKIESAHSKVHEFSGMTDGARRILHSMARRDVQQKMVLYGLALIILGAIGFVVYYVTK